MPKVHATLSDQTESLTISYKWMPYTDPFLPRSQAMTMSSVGFDLSDACDLPGRLWEDRALPGLLECVLRGDNTAAVRAAPCCKASWSARMP